MSIEFILFTIIFTISLIHWIRQQISSTSQLSAKQIIAPVEIHDAQNDGEEDFEVNSTKEKTGSLTDTDQDTHIFDLDIHSSFQFITIEHHLFLGRTPLQGYPHRFSSKAFDSKPHRYRFRPEIRFRPKTTWDRISSTLHMTTHIHTSDKEFDDKVCIVTLSKTAFVKDIICNPNIRKNILTLLSLQDSNVVLYSRQLAVSWQFEEPADDVIIDQEQLDNACGLLQEIHHSLPSVRISKPQRRPIHRSVKILIPIVFLTFAILSLREDWSHTWQVFDAQFEKDNIFFALYMYLLTLPVLFFLTRGASNSLSTFAISSLLHGFNMLSFVPPYFLFFNAFYDKNPQRTIVVAVQEKWIVNPNHEPAAHVHYVRVQSSAITPEQDFIIDHNLYLQIKKNVRLDVGQGYLSQQWLVNMEALDES